MARVLPALLVPALAGLTAAARADEGQWPPGALAELPQGRLQSLGAALKAEDLWHEDGGLLRAVVNYGGCSGAFVSAEGLIATNHHCAYPALQAASSVEHDYLKDGFVARTRAEELQAKGRSDLLMLTSIEDVTAQVRAAADAAPEDAARRAAVDAQVVALAEACQEGRPHLRCEVKAAFLGARYERHTNVRLQDVRVVYAPPSAIGEYGGEVDNWMWPRHSGDFALLRAYVGPDGLPRPYAPDNVPYRPAVSLALGHEGVGPGDFVAVLGFPGHTQRYLWPAALRHEVEVALPAQLDLYGEWLELTRAAGAADRAVAIKVAALHKGLANRHKNLQGMLAGIQRMDLLARREAEGAAARAAAEGRKDLEALQAMQDLARVSAAAREDYPRALLLESLPRGPRMLATAVDLVRRAQVRHLPDAQRRPTYQERNAEELLKAIERRIADFDRDTEVRLLASWLRRVDALPPGRRVVPVDLLKQRLNAPSPESMAQAILAGTVLDRPGLAKRLFDRGSPSDMREAGDALLAFALALAPELEKVELQRDLQDGLRLRVAPDYVRALAAVRPGPLYPDANGTLRVSLGQVMGYQPRDGLAALPQTTLQGQLAKDTGADPFALPASVRAAAAGAAAGYFADPILADVPVCFLANGDTTGGNSGSALIDGRGRWVGLNFDRVWENIAGDVAYNPAQSRNVSVDVRYILWLLSITDGAQPILQELGALELAKRPRRAPPAEVSAPKAPPEAGRAACRCAGTAPGAPLGAGGVFLGLGLLWRRRRSG
jgi:hypothetical protein